MESYVDSSFCLIGIFNYDLNITYGLNRNKDDITRFCDNMLDMYFFF